MIRALALALGETEYYYLQKIRAGVDFLSANAPTFMRFVAHCPFILQARVPSRDAPAKLNTGKNKAFTKSAILIILLF